jgi:hypothetical protein
LRKNTFHIKNLRDSLTKNSENDTDGVGSSITTLLLNVDEKTKSILKFKGRMSQKPMKKILIEWAVSYSITQLLLTVEKKKFLIKI